MPRRAMVRVAQMTQTPSPLMRLAGLLSMGLAALVARGFYLAGSFYAEYPQPANMGFSVPVRELAFQALYLAFGVPFLLMVATGLWWTGFAGWASEAFRRFARHPRAPTMTVLLTVAGSLVVRFFVLDRQVITDDEEVYLFIARTLLSGHVVNPLPDDASFFANQYVVLNAHGWFGKYPIGHGFVLALGLVSGTLDAVVCLLGGATAALTYEVGRRTVGPRRAFGALLLLALSPHFVWTHATLLSQTTCGFGLMASTAAWLAWQRRRKTGWLVVSGFAMALTIAARPMPGLLFAAALGAATLWAWRSRRATWAQVAVFAAMSGLGVVLQLLVNLAQSGSVLHSGYHETQQGTLGVLGGVVGSTGLSVFGGLWRENFWLLGWPLSLLPLLGARVHRGAWLLWSPVLAELIYRVAFPKTSVSTTGPSYLLEMVPVLCLLTADGLARGAVLARQALRRSGALAAFVLASTVTAFVFFVPVQVAAVRGGAQAHREVWTQLERAGVTSAVVFTDTIIELTTGKSWSFFPPSVSPGLDDELVFVRWPHAAKDPQRAAWEFAQRRFPGRPVFRFTVGEKGRLEAVEAPSDAAPWPGPPGL